MKYILAVASILLCSALHTQPLEIEWQQIYGGSKLDRANKICHTSDSGFLIVGMTTSEDGDISLNHHSPWGDFWIVKVNSYGGLQWEKSLGQAGFEDDEATCVRQTNDGGYIICGYISSSFGNASVHYGDNGISDCWVVKLDNAGNILWEKTYGGSFDDKAYDIQQTPDNGYLIAASTASTDHDITSSHGSLDAWLIKTDSQGEIIWQKTYGGTGQEEFLSVQLRKDSGFVVAGYSNSIDGDFAINHAQADFLIASVNQAGELQWKVLQGGSGTDIAQTIFCMSDSNFLVAGKSNSIDGDVDGNHGLLDGWLMKIGRNGQILWKSTYGGSSNDALQGIVESNDTQLLITGSSSSMDGDVLSTHSSLRSWIIEIDTSGHLLWSNIYNSGAALDITKVDDRKFIFVGWNNSDDPDFNVNFPRGEHDFWIAKIGLTKTVCNNASYLQLKAEKTLPSSVIQWQINTGNGFEDLFENNQFSGVNSPTLTITNPTGVLTTYSFRTKLIKGENELFEQELNFSFKNIWQGFYSTDWDDPTNWGCNSVPDIYTEIEIPNLYFFPPTIQNDKIIKSLIMSKDAQITIPPGLKLEITGAEKN